MSETERELIRKTYKTLERVTNDFETRWHFNSAIALIMDLTNAIYAAEPLEKDVRPEVRREILEMVTLMLAPMTPHLAEELWEMVGHSEGLWNAKWPYLGVEQIELARDVEAACEPESGSLPDPPSLMLFGLRLRFLLSRTTSMASAS